MTLSLSPQLLKQPIHISSLFNTPLQPSNSRQFTTVVHGSGPGHESLPTTMGQTKADPLHSSSYGYASVTQDNHRNKLDQPSQVVPDLPAWTPLKEQGDGGGLAPSDTEVLDVLAPRKETVFESAIERPAISKPPNNGHETAESERTSSSDARPFKKARFDSVFISTKPRPYRKSSARASSKRASVASNALSLSLVDALARTFDANRYTEDVFLRQPRPASRRKDDGSTGPQTDVETTEAEDEVPRPNTRLTRVHPERRRGEPARTIAPWTNFEDAAVFLPQFDRPAKRLKAIQYEANSALIDEALGTAQASISWDAEIDIITRDDDFVTPAYAAAAAEVRMDIDGVDVPADSPENACVPSSSRTPVENAWHMPTSGGRKQPVLSPYLSRGAQFRQRLDAAFGEHATVRTDRSARPRPVDYDLYFFTPPDVDEFERESVSESTASEVSDASTVEELALASAVPSSRVTSQPPDTPPSVDGDTNMMDRLRAEELSAVDASTKPALDVNEEQMSGWIVALQRLIKGKVRVKEEDLEGLSIILAEIESVKGSLDPRTPITSELRESVKQLSKLYEIPFGDRNKLRQRAEDIFRALPSVGKLGAS